MATEVILPVLGETMDEGTIVRWLVEVGTPVSKGDPLYEVETDKAVLEVEAPSSGVLRKVLQPAGSKVPVLGLVGLIAGADEDISGYEPAAAEEGEGRQSRLLIRDRKTEAVSKPSQGTSQAAERIVASPRARRLASERGVDLAQIVGSGPGGRIVERDVQQHLAAGPVATPTARKYAAQHGIDLTEALRSFAAGKRVTKADLEALAAGSKGRALPGAFAPAKREPLSGIRAVIAERMSSSAHSTARVTLTTQVDATALARMRQVLNGRPATERQVKVTYTDILVAVVARALRELPYMKTRLDEGEIEQLTSVHVGVAVDTERGLLVPVVRDADQKTVMQIASTLRELTERARSGTSLPDDLSGGTFTITNLGMYGIDAFTPIINPPECAILGMGRLHEIPVVYEGVVCARLMLALSLTFDHRLVDGAPAARFLQGIAQIVEEPCLLLA